MSNDIFLWLFIICGIIFIALFVYLIRDTAKKRREAQRETQEYYVATTDADDED